MKIAQVTHNYLPHIGGIEFYVYRLTRDLEREGNFVNILTTDLNTEKQNREKNAIYFKAFPNFMRNPFSFGLLRHLLRESYNVIHIHSIWFLPGLISVLFRKKSKIITTIHGVYPDKTNLLLKTFLKIYKPLANFVLKKSDIIIVLSSSEKNKLVKIFSIDTNKVRVIPNGIDLGSPKKLKKEKIILFTGRIIHDKNPEVLIKATSIVNREYKHLSVIFVGPIELEYKIKLKKLINNLGLDSKVRFLPPLSINERNKLLEIYERSFVFVSLGDWEGLPTRLMEAMQFEVPCITYSSGGSSELIKDRHNGLVIHSLDEKLLASKIVYLLKNQRIARKLGKNARITVLKRFNWHIIFRDIYK